MVANQNRNKVFLVIIAILVITNIAMLGILLQKKAPGKDQGAKPDKKAFISNLLQQEIGFSREQLVQYDTLSSLHRQRVGRLYDGMRANKTPQFRELVANNFNDTAISAMADQSTMAQKNIEVNMFNHIKRIRLLCTPEQLPKFDSLFVKVFNWREESRKKLEK